MNLDSKIAIVVAENLPMWQKLNVVAFLSSGITGGDAAMVGEPYEDGSGQQYSPLCIQPIVILSAARSKLKTFLGRAERRGVAAAIYIEDMFTTGNDEDNRATVTRYATEALPLVGIAVRAERKAVDKIFKGARLHE